MAKIKLGAKPEAFKPIPVKFPFPGDGSESIITVTFVYRTQEEYGNLLNESKTQEGQPLPTKEDGSIDFALLYGRGTKANADFLMQAIKSWDMDEPLNVDSLQALGNEFPAAVIAITAAYGQACREGRLGN